MTNDELEAAGLYQCESCDRVYESEKSRMFCCRDEYDGPHFRRNYEIGNN